MTSIKSYDNSFLALDLNAQIAFTEAMFFSINEENCYILPIAIRRKMLGDFKEEKVLKIRNLSDFDSYKNDSYFRDFEFGKKKRKW